MVISSMKSDRETLKKGTPLGWGQIIDVTEKHNCFGIGYHPSSRLPNQKNQKKLCLAKFNSVEFQCDNIMVVIEGLSRREVTSFVHKCQPGFTLNNWSASVVPTVFSITT